MGSGPARYANGAATRERILAAAREELIENGYARVSLGEVARRAGISAPGLSHYFAAKEDLFLELLHVRDEQFADPVTSLHPQPIAETLDAVARNASEPDLVRLFVAMAADATVPNTRLHEWFANRYRTYLHNLEEDVLAYQERGEIRGDLDAGVIASLMFAAADGLQTQWLLDPKVDMAGRLRSLWDSFRTPDGP